MVVRAFFCLFFAITSAQEQDARVVALAQGAVRGYRGADGDYFAFYGIPYATAPTGRDKYKTSLPAPTSTETFDAVDKNIICPQIKTPKGGNGTAEEQCLIANIYVPDTDVTNLSVVVYVHGGGYIVGFGNMVIPKDIVIQGKLIAVNFNYRLGFNGFLCLGTENIPGNAGMKDMVALLRWAKQNIANFGRNPDDVTISGYSSGSAAADLLTSHLWLAILLVLGLSVEPPARVKTQTGIFYYTTNLIN